MSRSSVRSLFLWTVVVLIVQYGLVGLVGVYASEPWPAVVLPGFKTVYGTADTLTVEHVSVDVHFEDGTTTVTPTQFLSMLPRSHHTAFFRTQCRPSSLSDRDGPVPCTTPAGRRWVGERAQALFPHRPVRRVEVVWSHLHFVPATQTTTRTPLDTLRLPVSAPPSS